MRQNGEDMRHNGKDMGQSYAEGITQYLSYPPQSATKDQSEPKIQAEFDTYLRQLGSCDAYLCPSGGFLGQMTLSYALLRTWHVGNDVQLLDVDMERGSVLPVARLKHDVANQVGDLADGGIALMPMAAPPPGPPARSAPAR